MNESYAYYKKKDLLSDQASQGPTGEPDWAGLRFRFEQR